MVTAADTDAALTEIAQAPAGPSVGAFFDFDGTLAAGFTGALLPWDHLRRGAMGPTELLGTLWAGLGHAVGRLDFEQFIRRGSMTLRGKHFDDLAAIGQRLYADNIAARIYPEAAELVAAHLARGHVVVLTSAAFHLQIEPVATALGVEHLLCNWCEVDGDGVLTGEVRKPILRGESKAQAVSDFAAAHQIELSESYFYADGDEDIPLMMLVGNPRPTNPAGGLARLAGERRWPIMRFTSRSGNIPVAGTRTTLATLAAIPLIAAAAAAAVSRRDPRRGYEFFASWWPRILLHLTGVRLNVVGGHHLESEGDAVYLINHRSVVDNTIVGALLDTYWAAMPSLSGGGGPRARLRQRASGSVVAAAEGAMLTERDVGDFDSQAFQLARDTGRRLVPIVIRNADVVAAHGSSILHPGTVDVVVLPPVAVDGLTDSELIDCAQRLRRDYVAVLRDRPAPG
jgi:putative phosphoserine phosphatase/1-acylglycerol-3-phosphate O-acyltransferase